MATPEYYANNAQDVGGLAVEHSTAASTRDAVNTPLQGLIEKSTKGFQFWEIQCHAFYTLLLGKGLVSAGEVRRAIEQLPYVSFRTKTYYEKWAAALAHTSIERGVIEQSELDDALGLSVSTPDILFKAGQFVRVKPENSSSRYRKPHLRTPGYLFGVIGKVKDEAVHYLEEPDISSYAQADGPKQPVYRVVFWQNHIWEGYSGSADDTIDIEIWQPWLAESDEQSFKNQRKRSAAVAPTLQQKPKEEEPSHPHHDHGDHVHEERQKVEQDAVDREGPSTADRSAFSYALIELFLKKGIVTAGELRERLELLESYGADPVGPKLVARAWVDPDFKARLLEDGMSAAQELGFEAPGYPPKGGITESSKELTGNLLVAVEDTADKYNLIVCTLCSCYPVHILGLSPSWYKSRAYRARSVREPREVLREFGTHLPDSVQIVVHDSTADTRYIKIPLRPAGTESWREEDLRTLLNRDSLIGVSHPRTPNQTLQQPAL